MRISDLQKKKHMFKNRSYKISKILKNLTIGNVGLYTISRIRYELVYLRVLKKCIRQKFIRRRIRFFKCKFWFFLKPNYILTSKPTNSRMGAGIGSLVRVTIRVDAYTNFICLRGYSVYWALTLYKKLRYKYPFFF